MDPTEPSSKHSAPRTIVITNESFAYGNIEAWMNIIRSYMEVHPRHSVTLLYEDEPIQNVTALFKMERPVNREGFKVMVSAPDEDLRHVSKLYRLLVEGAGPDYSKFLQREIHRTLRLF